MKAEAGNESSGAVKSPLSNLPPEKIRDLPKSFILEKLESYYGTRPPAGAVETDYSLWRCTETGLEFAWPMLPGNLPFYEWISGFDSYYPGIRWEYGEVRRLIGPDANATAGRVLDVGCGTGDFLAQLDHVPVDRRFALDMNQPAVEACRRKGFPAFCGTIEAALKAGFVQKGQFPVVTSFHCLEHVDSPVDFVKSLASVTASGGRLFLSTPYSPMSFESEWFDVLNHPPHHMTRWNLAAYQGIAKLLGAKMRYFVPPSSPFNRALNVFSLLRYGPHSSIRKPRRLLDALFHLPAFMSHYQKQKLRGQGEGGVAADVILVEYLIR